jgi:hypothetical protein
MTSHIPRSTTTFSEKLGQAVPGGNRATVRLKTIPSCVSKLNCPQNACSSVDRQYGDIRATTDEMQVRGGRRRRP